MDNEDSMMEELEIFKSEDISSFKFEIPLKYQIFKNLRLIDENLRKDGTIIKYYENSVVEIITHKNTIKRIFPDGYTITFYHNKDIKQVC